MTERLAGLCCIGCGKIEVPRPCIGICQDRVCEIVSASDSDDAMAQVASARREGTPLARWCAASRGRPRAMASGNAPIGRCRRRRGVLWTASRAARRS